MTKDNIWRATEREMMRSIIESEVDSAWTTIKEQLKKIPVVMRLGETPVLIPNTMVKT